MKKRWIALALILAMISMLFAACGEKRTGGQIAAGSRNGVVRIAAELPTGSIALGTGFGVGKAGEPTDIFVTNWHVVGTEIYKTKDGDYVALPPLAIWILKNSSAWNPGTRTLDTSQCIPCTVLYEADQYPDMAIIQAAEIPADRVALPLQKEESSLEVGDNVFALGYPGSSDEAESGVYGEKWVAGVEDVTVTSGVVSRFTTSATFGNSRLIQHDATINHGNSGGPLLDEHGAVIGINTYVLGHSGISKGDSMSSYSVRIEYVKDVLDDLEIEWEPYSGSSSLILILIAVAVVLAAGAVTMILLRTKPWEKAGPFKLRGKSNSRGSSVIPGDTGLRFQGVSGVFAGQRFAITPQLRLGRDPARSDFVYPAGTQGVSGLHCMLLYQSGQLFIQDLGSTYGTFLNGGVKLTPNQPALLRIGDTFSLGSPKETFVITRKGGV